MIKRLDLFFIILAFIVVATFRLQDIPGEWFGDISIINNYVFSILSGQWPLGMSTSLGPLYFYLIAPVIKLVGPSFLVYKLISVAVGAGGLIIIYLFSKEVASKRVALLTTLLTAFSFWYLIWSRIGYNIIYVPLTAAMMFFLLRYIKEQQNRFLILSSITACLGLFTYAGTFLLPVVLFICLLYALKKKKTDLQHLFIAGATCIPFVCLFLLSILLSGDNFTTGYMGAKIFAVNDMSPLTFFSRLITNIIRTILMFHVEGDIVFRWNVTKSPHLDFLSGVYFVIGIFSVIKQKHKNIFYIFAPLLILPLLSISPTNPPVEIPSISRTITIIPFVFLCIAYGVESLYLMVSKKQGKKIAVGVISISIGCIICLNLYKYFVEYPQGLPNKNTPFGKIIANYIDTIPSSTSVLLADSRWGDWGQPEEDAIYFSLKNKTNRENIRYSVVGACTSIISQKNIVIILDPHNATRIQEFKKCFPEGKVVTHNVNNQDVFTSLEKINK